MNHRATGLGAGTDRVLHLVGDPRRRQSLGPADRRHDLATELRTCQPPVAVVDVEAITIPVPPASAWVAARPPPELPGGPDGDSD